ncbi:MAG: hypothetical protein ACUVV0_00425 [Anaerolineae bacterium]
MRLALALIGFVSMVGQVLLLRELAAVFYGNELSLALILAAWLLWVAVGSWGLGRLAGRYNLGARAFVCGLALMALLLPAQMFLIRALRLILGATPGILIGFFEMARSIFLVLAPLCLLLGFSFILGSRLMVRLGGTVGRAYVYESWGAMAGGVLFSFFLLPWLNPFQIALLLGAVELAVGAWVIRSWKLEVGSWRLERWGVWAMAGGAVFLLALAWPLGESWHQGSLRWELTGLLFSRDSIYGRLTVIGRDGQRIFYENGLIMFETQGVFPEEVVHIPMLGHPAPKSVLLIGGGASGDLREILKHPVDFVRYVELDPLVIEAARQHLPPEDRASLEDRRVQTALMDGRLYVKIASEEGQRFDVVILDLPEPSTGQLNRFYTLEFFQEVKGVLKEGGVFSLGLPSAENYQSLEFRRRNGSVYHTLRDVFPHVIVLPGDTNFFLASDSPVVEDYTLLARRLAGREIETRWVNSAYLEYLFTAGRYERTRRELEEAPARLNRDLAPICYYYDLALWLSRFYPGMSELFYSFSFLEIWWLAGPLVFLAAFFRWKRAWAVPALIVGTGFSEMALEVALLLAFQAFRGYVYHEVSLIYAAFMAGTAAGGALAERWLARALPGRRLLLPVQAVLVAYAALLPTLLKEVSAWPEIELVFLALVFLAGLLGGMEFPLSVSLVRGEAGRKAGLIYGADLLGACLGAVLAGVLFIPVLGISQTCYAVALIGLAGLSFIL